jgi:hypothetical protein
MNHYVVTAAVIAAVAWPSVALSQVLGACGTTSENEPAAPAEPGAGDLQVQPVPLPGQRAFNFELPAVIGDEIRNVKLSDYNGQWRVLCFYPADFTFV